MFTVSLFFLSDSLISGQQAEFLSGMQK